MIMKEMKSNKAPEKDGILCRDYDADIFVKSQWCE